MKWHRHPSGFGWISGDRQFFLERGVRMTHGANAWLIWEKADPADIATDDGYKYLPGKIGVILRPLDQVTYTPEDGTDLYYQEFEGGWLSEAKSICEEIAAKNKEQRS